MIFKQEGSGFTIFYPFKGEEYYVGVIIKGINDSYAFKDRLFKNEIIKSINSLDKIKDVIITYYGQKDTIGKLELIGRIIQ